MRPMNVIALIASIVLIISMFLPFVSAGIVVASFVEIETSAALFVGVFALGMALICVLEDRLSGLAALSALAAITVGVLLHVIGATSVGQALKGLPVASIAGDINLFLGFGAYILMGAVLILFVLGIADHRRPHIGR